MKFHCLVGVVLGALGAFAATSQQDGVLALLETLDAPVVTNAAPIVVPPQTNVLKVQAAPVTNIVELVVTNTVLADLEEKRRISTRTFQLHYANAEEVAEKFNSTWSGDFGISFKIAKIAQAFPEANTVMVTAPGAILDACEQVVREVDVEPPQVYIEARFVELQNSASHKLGIDWSMLDSMQGTASFGGGMDRRTIGNAVQNYVRETTTGTDDTSYGLAGKTTTSSQTLTETIDSSGHVTSATRSTTGRSRTRWASAVSSFQAVDILRSDSHASRRHSIRLWRAFARHSATDGASIRYKDNQGDRRWTETCGSRVS